MSTRRPTPAATAADPPGLTRYAPAYAAEARLMQDHLARLRPGSGSEALRALREAFPTASLAARVAAMARHAEES